MGVMGPGDEMHGWWRSRYFCQLWSPAWMGFLLVNPALWICLTFFSWPKNVTFDDPEFCVGYFGLTVLVLLVRLCRDPLGQIAPMLAFIFFTAFGLVAMPIVNILGFDFYIYPEAGFIQNHCHPVSFLQDKKTYFVGLCDETVYPDEGGQIDFSVLYDTSGDVLEAGYADQIKQLKEIKNWVDAIRKGQNDNPNEVFEFADYNAENIDGDFYQIHFDDANGEGFTEAYGPPPYDPKNPYHSIFHADPEPLK